MMVTFELTDEYVSSKTPLSKVEMSWASLIKIIKFREGFLFYTSERQFLWLPIHAFSDPDDVSRVADVARTKVRRYRERPER